MTDMEAFKTALDQMGVNYQEEETDDLIFQSRGEAHRYKWSITVSSGIGYCNAEASFYFDRKGHFLIHGVWDDK